MKIGGIQPLTLLDYPGHTAATVFVTGCNMRCPFCHNADLVYDSAQSLTEKDVYALIEKRKNMLSGVCITGGEPLLYEETEELIANIKKTGLKVKLDTNGTKPGRLKKLVNGGLIDYAAMDIKSSYEGYPKACGVPDIDMDAVTESIAFLKEGRIPYEFRTTAVKQLHGEKEFLGIAKLIEGADKFFIQKFKDPGELVGHHTGAFLFFDALSDEETELFRKTVASVVKTVGVRG